MSIHHPTMRFIVVVAMITLGGCEFIGSHPGQTSPVAESSGPEPAPADSESISAKSTSSAIEAAAVSTGAAIPPELQVAVLDRSDFANARARHKQALLESSDNALAGADVGYYMDVQKAQFLQLLHNSNVEIKQQGDFIILNMPGGDNFETDSARLGPAARESLTSISQVLVEFKDTQITIHGHTDDAGDAGYNQKLSVRRALSVAQYLVDAGISEQRIAIVGYGESRPVNPNTTPDGRAQNRRIELHLDAIAR